MMKKRALIFCVLFLVVVVPFASASFFDAVKDFFSQFTGNAVSDYGTMEGDCKKDVIIAEGETRSFLFLGQNYDVTLKSADDKVHLTVNGQDFDLGVPSERVMIYETASLKANKMTEQYNKHYLTLTLNSEKGDCRCVGDDYVLSQNSVEYVSDNVNQFRMEIAEFNYDDSSSINSYVTYKVNGKTTEKAFRNTVLSLGGLKVVTKTINADGTASIALDNSANCASETAVKEENEIKLGLQTVLKPVSSDSSVKIYTLIVPVSSAGSTFVTTPEGKFDFSGNLIVGEAAVTQECPTPEPAAEKKKSFWECIWGN